MKKILVFSALFFSVLASFAQSKGYARYDTFYITKTGGFGELVLENHTQDSVNGALTNIGKGRTEFRRILKQLNDTQYLVGGDTLKLPSGSNYVTPLTTNGDILARIAGADARLPKGSDGSFLGVQSGSLGYYTPATGPPVEQFLGQIYSATSWASASTGFDNTGATVSLSGGKLVITGGAGTYDKALVIQKPSQLDKWTIGGNFILGTVTGSSYGFGVGKYGVAKNGTPVKIVSRFTPATGGGQLLLDIGNGSSVNNKVTSAAALTFSTGDKIYLSMSRDGALITATVRNLTTNSAPVRISYDATTSFATQAFVLDNIGEYGIYTFGGSVTVDSLGVYSKTPKNAALALLGDSKTQGYDVTLQQNRLGEMLNKYYSSTINLGGGNEVTGDWSARLYELIALRPQNVLIMGASNSIRYAESGYLTRYDSIVTALQAAGINVFHSTGWAETSLDQSPLNNHIYATFPADHIIETYAATNIPGALFSDGIHPNDFGDSLALNAILKSNKIPNGTTKFEINAGGGNISGTVNTIPKFFGSSNAIGNSSLTDDGVNFVTTSEAVQAKGFTVYNPSGGTDGKYWNTYYSGDYLNYTTVNDAQTVNNAYMQVHRVGNSADQVLFNEPITTTPGADPGYNVVMGSSNHVGYSVTGTTSSYYIPLLDNQATPGGMYISMQNSSSASGAYAGAYFSTTGTNSASGSPFVAFRDNNDGNEWVIGRNNATGDFNINTGNFAFFGSGNKFKVTQAGVVSLGGYGSGTITGTPAATLGVDNTGKLIEIPAPAVASSPSSGTGLVKNGQYISHGSSLNTYPLPATAAEGDQFIVLGEGTGGWKISQNSGQQIVSNSFSTTTGATGYIASGSRYAIVVLRCLVANTTFGISGQQGTINYN